MANEEKVEKKLDENEELKALKLELAALKAKNKKGETIASKFEFEKGEKLGNINGKEIFCKHACPNCPKKKKEPIVVIYNKDENGLCNNITCKSMSKAQ